MIDSPVSIEASKELEPSPLKLTVKFALAVAVFNCTAWVFVSMLMFDVNVPLTKTFSAKPWILPLPFNVTLPIPFGVKLKSILVSSPVAAMLGAEPVAWLVIVTSFTAVAVLTNLMYSLF